MQVTVSRPTNRGLRIEGIGRMPFEGRASLTKTLRGWLKDAAVRDVADAAAVIMEAWSRLELGGSISAEVDGQTEVTSSPFTLTVRETLRSITPTIITQESPRTAFKVALSKEWPEGDIRWQDIDRLCVLDLDVPKDSEGVSDHEISEVTSKLGARPLYVWPSKSRGLHMVYEERDGHSAYDLAAAGAVEVLEMLPWLRAELLPHTRFPPAEFPPWHFADCDGDRLWCWRQVTVLGESPAEDAIEDFLLDNGLEWGRNPHIVCPFNPGPIDGADPVEVDGRGITCFRCKQVGPGKGRAEWGWLLLPPDKRERSRIETCAINRVPWEHARFVVKEDYAPEIHERIVAAAYRVLCRDLAHKGLWVEANRVLQKFRVARGAGGVWVDPNSLEMILPKVGEKRLSALPSVRVNGVDGPRASPVLVDLYCGNQRLPGWPEIVPVRGCRVWGQHLQYPDRGSVYPVSSRGTPYPVRYVGRSVRRPLGACEQQLRKLLPGVDLIYLRLLIVARGYAESLQGPVPMILVTGPSGAGKSATARLAAALLDDNVAPIPDDRKFDETIGFSATKAGFMLWDEYGKGYAGRQGTRAVFDNVLRMERKYAFRLVYVGPTTVGLNSVIVITNTSYTREALNHQQAARRLVYLPMYRRISDWRKTVGDIEKWRYDQNRAELADHYLSWLIDEHFSEPALWFEEARRLGVRSLEEHNREGIAASADEDVRKFFRELQEGTYVCKADQIVVPFNSDAMEQWLMLADSQDGALMGNSTVIGERDLIDVLGYQGDDADSSAIRFESSRSHEGVVVSLVLGDRHGGDSRLTNFDLLKQCKLGGM